MFAWMPSCSSICHPGRAKREPGSVSKVVPISRWVPGRCSAAPGMTGSEFPTLGDSKVKGKNNGVRPHASYALLVPHQVGEAAKQIMAVARAGRGFRMILNREH